MKDNIIPFPVRTITPFLNADVDHYHVTLVGKDQFGKTMKVTYESDLPIYQDNVIP